MKFIYVLFFILFSSGICYSQFILKINSGVSYNHLITDISNRTFSNNENGIGYNAAINLKFNAIPFVDIESGICWIQKNYSIRRTESFSGIYDRFANNYVQIPLTVQLKVFENKKIAIFFGNGIFASYLIYSRVIGVIPNVFNTSNQLDTDGQSIQNFYLTYYANKYHFIKQKDNRIEFGFKTGLAFQYKFKERTGFFIEYSLYQSLTDIQKKYMINQVSKINQTHAVVIGYCINFD